MVAGSMGHGPWLWRCSLLSLCSMLRLLGSNSPSCSINVVQEGSRLSNTPCRPIIFQYPVCLLDGQGMSSCTKVVLHLLFCMQVCGILFEGKCNPTEVF